MSTITEAARAFLAAHDKAAHEASTSRDREEEFEALEAMRCALAATGTPQVPAAVADAQIDVIAFRMGSEAAP